MTETLQQRLRRLMEQAKSGALRPTNDPIPQAVQPVAEAQAPAFTPQPQTMEDLSRLLAEMRAQQQPPAPPPLDVPIPEVPQPVPAPEPESPRRRFRRRAGGYRQPVNYRKVERVTVETRDSSGQQIVVIYFPGVPAQETRDALKARGFKFNLYGDGGWSHFATPSNVSFAHGLK